MKKNDYNFLTDKVFFAEELIFDVPGKKISQNEIDEIDDFPGKEEFIKFYTAHNGGAFLRGAWFFPEECYNISIKGESYISMDRFLIIPVGDANEKFNIDRFMDLITFGHKSYEDFMLFHIPFALDIVSNPFWIDIQTGEIKYTDYEVCLNPDEDAVIVASSFKNFCKCIKKNQLMNVTVGELSDHRR